MGKGEFVSERFAVSGNKLNLASWHGYNTVFYFEKVDLSSLEFDLFLNSQSNPRLGDGTYSSLSIILGHNGDNYLGIRISDDLKKPSIFFEASRTGKILKKTNLNFGIAEGNSTVLITVLKNEVSVYKNSKFVQKHYYSREPGVGYIGFKSNILPVISIDNIHIRNKTMSYKENFKFTDNIFVVFLSFFSFVVVCAFTVNYLCRDNRNVIEEQVGSSSFVGCQRVVVLLLLWSSSCRFV